MEKNNCISLVAKGKTFSGDAVYPESIFSFKDLGYLLELFASSADFADILALSVFKKAEQKSEEFNKGEGLSDKEVAEVFNWGSDKYARINNLLKVIYK